MIKTIFNFLDIGTNTFFLRNKIFQFGIFYVNLALFIILFNLYYNNIYKN